MISEYVNFDPMVSELAVLSCPALSQKEKKKKVMSLRVCMGFCAME